MNRYDPLVYVVPPEDEGMKLINVLKNRLGLSRKMLIRLKTVENAVLLNGESHFLNVKVKAGDRVEVRLEKETSDGIDPEPLPLRILYEDEYLMVIDKPADMVVHPTRGYRSGTVANAAVFLWRQRGETGKFHPVHRLDRDTTGVLVIAKHAYAHQRIAEQWAGGKVIKEYLAIVHGQPPVRKGTVDAPIGRDPRRPYMRTVTMDGAPAVTHYALQASWKRASLIRLCPETGRTHQIRVHMQALGCPLIGDPLYGNPDPGNVEEPWWEPYIQRQALHAGKVAFAHPATGDWVEFTAELPEDMRSLLAFLSAAES